MPRAAESWRAAVAEKEYIEREALLKVVEKRLDTLRKEFGDYDPYAGGYDERVDRISEAPPAEVVEVRHGYWYFTEYEYFSCSVCGQSPFNFCDSTAEARRKLADGEVYPYCPECGAKMDGEND
jgi:hypothetical protein